MTAIKDSVSKLEKKRKRREGRQEIVRSIRGTTGGSRGEEDAEDDTGYYVMDKDDDSIDGVLKETLQKPVSLPAHGQVQLRQFHTKSSAVGKLLAYQQVLQLGMSAIRACFTTVLIKPYINDNKFMEQLFCVIFFECSERRMMLEGAWCDCTMSGDNLSYMFVWLTG